MITVETKTNGYRAEGLQGIIAIFEKAAEKLFPNCKVSHFYYGDHLDMIDLIIDDDNYAHFNLTANRVSLCGYSLANDHVAICESMTYRDELYSGKLLEIA